MSRYFLGAGRDLGNVAASPLPNFSSLCAALSTPIILPMTRVEFWAKSAKERQAVKRVAYLTPCTFPDSTSRKTENAGKCNLIALDIDDAAEAKRLLAQDWSVLGDFAYLVWSTVSSTPEKPRLRVLVSAEGIPVNRYASAVRTIGETLGLSAVTRESLVPVQPMFLPTGFQGQEGSPIIASNPEGESFMSIDIIDQSEASIAVDEPGAEHDGTVADLTHLRAPMEGIALADAEDALKHLDPDMPMQEWIEVAAALKHQFDSAEALAVWDAWSAKGKKYVDSEETAYRWGTLKSQPTDRAPVTIRSLFKKAQARGWSNPTLAKRGYAETLKWIQSPARSTEELFDQGTQRIAKISPMVGAMEKKSLIVSLRDAYSARKIPIPLPDIKREVKRLELETAKATGTPAWAKGLCFVTSLNLFYRPTTDRRFAPEVLDLMYGSPQIGDEAPMRPRDYLMQVVGVQQVENLRYDPSRGEKRFFVEENVPYVNTYRANHAPSDPERADEAGEIFWEHICHLVKEPAYRQTLVDFMAYQVQHPGKKIRWAVLMQGAQGCGKTALAVAMGVVLGRRNVRKLTATDVLEGQHNDWAYGQQLVAMEEVRIVGHNRYGVMDKLKPCISDDEISLHRKFEHHQTVPNITNYMMFTNHHDALAINDADRRYFVIASPLQNPGDIARIGGEKYFNRLFGMIRDNPGGLRAWLEKWPLGEAFNPEGRAPVTPYMKDLAANSASPLSAAVFEAVEENVHPLVQKDLVSLGSLRAILDTEHLPSFTDQALAAVLREHGFQKAGRMTVNGGKHQLWSKGEIADVKALAEIRDGLIG